MVEFEKHRMPLRDEFVKAGKTLKMKEIQEINLEFGSSQHEADPEKRMKEEFLEFQKYRK